jgi:hypothetical protein
LQVERRQKPSGPVLGSFLRGYVFVMITLSLVCAVFSPVWFKWRETERNHDEGSPTAAESVVAP